MIAGLATALAVVVVLIAVLHALWGLGNHWPAASAEAAPARSTVGTPGITRMPGPASCLGVATLLAGVALWPLFAMDLRRVPEQPFAANDPRYYSPLCLAGANP